MGFVYDDGEVPVFAVDFVVDDGEFLEGGDDDGYAGVEGFFELGGVFVDFFDDAGDVVELVDGVLKLGVEDFSVGYDDDGVEYFGVGLVVEAHEPVGEPGDGVGFAASGTMLDEVVFAGSVLTDVFEKFGDGVELVVSGEDEGFFAGFVVFCDVEIFVEEFKEGVFLEDVFPEVGRGVASIRGGRVAFSAGDAGSV